MHVGTYISVLTRTTLGIFNPFKKHFTSGIPEKYEKFSKVIELKERDATGHKGSTVMLRYEDTSVNIFFQARVQYNAIKYNTAL
jgi:hypothetical protein